VADHGWSGVCGWLFGRQYRPQISPARPTTQNKIGWLGAVAVSGWSGSPAAFATIGAKSGRAGTETTSLQMPLAFATLSVMIVQYERQRILNLVRLVMDQLQKVLWAGLLEPFCGARLFARHGRAEIAPPCESACNNDPLTEEIGVQN
jgi:hypothetical protein